MFLPLFGISDPHHTTLQISGSDNLDLDLQHCSINLDVHLDPLEELVPPPVPVILLVCNAGPYTKQEFRIWILLYS